MSLKERAKTAPKTRHRALSGKTVVKLFTQDGVRELLIPSEEPNYYPIVVHPDRLFNIKAQAAKEQHCDPVKERERLANLSHQRKEHFSRIDATAAKKRHAQSEFEREAKEKANYVLQRAWELKMEQEDEIKAANSLILITKCQAIRDAQLAEQEIIKRKLLEDELHIDRSMEQERLRKLLEEKRNRERQRCVREEYITELNKQIKEIHDKKVLVFEKAIHERQKLKDAMNHMMMEEAKKRQKTEIQKEKTRRELAMANEQLRKTHMLEKEEARLADLKVQEWMKQRAEREEDQERCIAEAKKRKELETARLRAMQEKAGELQAQQEHMLAIRRQEEHEREWRRKEMEATKKKKANDEKCLEVRKRQITELRQIQANEIAREKKEFEQIQRIQEELDKKQKAEQERRRSAAKEHRDNLMRQMKEKQIETKAKRGEELKEGVAVRAEVAKREDDIRKVLHNKISQMRMHKVPEMYVADIKRQLHLHDGD